MLAMSGSPKMRQFAREPGSMGFRDSIRDIFEKAVWHGKQLIKPPPSRSARDETDREMARSKAEELEREQLRSKYGLDSFTTYIEYFTENLHLIANRRGDTEDVEMYLDFLVRYAAYFENIWETKADIHGPEIEVDEAFWVTAEQISKFVLRLENRRDIDKCSKMILRLFSKQLLRPLQERTLNAAAQRPYCYGPLEHGQGQIRILHLLSKRGQPLRCRIEHIEIQLAQFTALSYEWGSLEKLYWIEVVDFDDTVVGILPLTNNLHSALCDIRDSSDVMTRAFWIDQICINQEDRIERGHQVDMMGKLYATAARVVSYCGLKDVYDHLGFDLLSRIDKKFNHLYSDPMFQHDLDETLSRFANPDQIPKDLTFEDEVESDETEALVEIILGPWTRRLWMLQETCVNTSVDDVLVLRGTRGLPWTMLAGQYVIAAAGLLPGIAIDMLGTLGEAAALFMCWNLRHRISTVELSDLLESCTGMAVGVEPSDRVFALLGLASDTEKVGVTADYSKSYEEVLIDVTVRLIKKGFHLQPLSCWSHKTLDKGQTLPSWVSRWPPPTETATSINEHTPAGYWKGAVNFSPDHRCMRIAGIRVSSIIQTIPGFSFSLSWSLSSHDLSQVQSAIATIRAHQNGQTVDPLANDGIIAKALCATSAEDEKTWEGKEAVASLLTLIDIAQRELKGLEDGAEVRLFSLLGNLPKEQREITSALIDRNHILYRAFCFTDCGRLCLAPAHTQVNDIVTVFGGGQKLYVLRPNGRKYQYVGDAYIHGVMNGELTTRLGWEKSIETFSII